MRPDLRICAERAANRAEGRIPDYSRQSELYALFDGVDRHTIHNDTAEPGAVAQYIKDGLGTRTFRVE